MGRVIDARVVAARGWTLRGPAALVLLLAIGACGTTVPLASSGSTRSDGTAAAAQGLDSVDPVDTTGPGVTATTAPTTDGVTIPAPVPGAQPLTTAGGTVPSARGTARPAPRSAGGTRTSAAAASKQPSSKPGASGPAVKGPASGVGFTATTASIGVEYIEGGDAFLASAGYGALTTGDAKGLVDTMLADVNKSGGLLGRKVVAVYQSTGAAEGSSNPSTTAEAVCAKFTQDTKVFAAVIASPAHECLAKAKVLDMYFGSVSDDQELNRTAPYTRRTSAYSFTHLAPLLVDRLFAQGFLTKDSKVGILYPQESSGAGDRIDDLLKSLLAAKGLKAAATYGYDFSSAVAAAGSAPNAVLPFRTAGVDRVISLDASVAYFMTAAEQQGYRPRYALNSYLNLARVMQTIPPQAQLVGSVGVGWQPLNDVSPSVMDVAPPGYATCAKYIADSGQTGNASALSVLNSYCDSVRLALYAATTGGGLDPDSMQRGLAAKGTAYPSASLLEAAFSDKRMDGAAGARDIGYDTGCSCFKYLSKTIYRS